MREACITINLKNSTSLETKTWNIFGEDERISIKWGDNEYSLILKENGDVGLEKWSLDNSGELNNVVKEIESI